MRSWFYQWYHWHAKIVQGSTICDRIVIVLMKGSTICDRIVIDLMKGSTNCYRIVIDLMKGSTICDRIVFDLMKEPNGKGYTAYTENYYTSPKLAHYLHSKKTYICAKPKRDLIKHLLKHEGCPA